MYQDIFKQIGLNINEAIIYEYLLKKGKVGAGEIIKNTPLKRGVVYNALADLLKKDLISEEKITKNKKTVAQFSPNHPQKLSEFVENKENELQKAERNLSANMSKLVSEFHLISNKPGVKYFEGMDGVKKVINDTLVNNKKKEILAYSDVAEYMKYLKKWNTDYYAPKRRELEIYEKVIIPDDKKAIEYMDDYIKNPISDRLTDMLFIDHDKYPFKTEVNIYENKVAFVTFSNVSPIGIIVENKTIYQTLKSIFEYTWNLNQSK